MMIPFLMMKHHPPPFLNVMLTVTKERSHHLKICLKTYHPRHLSPGWNGDLHLITVCGFYR